MERKETIGEQALKVSEIEFHISYRKSENDVRTRVSRVRKPLCQRDDV
jgi:hypothetical protein